MPKKLHIEWRQSKGCRTNATEIMSDMEQSHLKDNLEMVGHVMATNIRENKQMRNRLTMAQILSIYSEIVKKLQQRCKDYNAVTQHVNRMVEVKHILNILECIKTFVHEVVVVIDMHFVENTKSNESPMMTQRIYQKANVLYALRMVENMIENVKAVF
jgi:HD superfamily phosphohydrolase